MKKILFVLLLYSTSSFASAPFGLEWGADLSTYGNTMVNGQTVTVYTKTLPKNYAKAHSYFLKGSSQLGLSFIRMSSETYELENTELKSIYDEVKESLLFDGYEFVKLQPGTFGSYQCILQSNCHGSSWHGKSKQGHRVMLLTQGSGKKRGYILLEFTAPHLLKQEEQLSAMGIYSDHKSTVANHLIF